MANDKKEDKSNNSQEITGRKDYSESIREERENRSRIFDHVPPPPRRPTDESDKE